MPLQRIPAPRTRTGWCNGTIPNLYSKGIEFKPPLLSAALITASVRLHSTFLNAWTKQSRNGPSALTLTFHCRPTSWNQTLPFTSRCFQTRLLPSLRLGSKLHTHTTGRIWSDFRLLKQSLVMVQFFSDMTSNRLLNSYGRFGGTWCFGVQRICNRRIGLDSTGSEDGDISS